MTLVDNYDKYTHEYVGKRWALNWNAYSGLLVAMLTCFQAMQWPLLPRFLDVYYHLAVMTGFNEAGGYVTQAFWEAAPVGRPHLYPPFLHVVMLLFHKMGLAPITIGRLVDCLIQPLVSICLWLVCRSIYGSRPAFWILLAWSSIYSLHLAAVTNAAFSIAMAMGFGVFMCIERHKTIPSVLLLGMSFYTHAVMSWFVLGAVLLYGVVNRQKLRFILTVAGLGLLFALPFLIHQARYRDYFGFVSVKENRSIDLDILIYVLAVAGIFLAVRRRGPHLFPLCLWVAMLPMALKLSARFISGHGIAGPAWLAGLVLAFVAEHIERHSRSPRGPAIFLTFSVVVLLALAPVLHVDRHDRKTHWYFLDRPIARHLMPESDRHIRAKEHTIYLRKEYETIVDIVTAHSEKDDIIWCDFAYGGGLIALLAGRATSSAMLQEVRPFRSFDPIAAAKLAIWFKSTDKSESEHMLDTVARYGLKKVAETGLVHIYRNANASGKMKVQSALLRTPWLFGILFTFLAVVITGFKKP